MASFKELLEKDEFNCKEESKIQQVSLSKQNADYNEPLEQELDRYQLERIES